MKIIKIPKDSTNLDTSLTKNLVEDLDIVNIDLTVEAGLGTIYVGAQYNQSALSVDLYQRDIFDDQAIVKLGDVTDQGVATGLYQLKEGAVASNGSDDQAYTAVNNYRAVANEFVNFAEFNRKDHMFIADPLRHIFVQGEGKQVLDHKSKTFTQHVYWPLRHLYGSINNSFSRPW